MDLPSDAPNVDTVNLSAMNVDATTLDAADVDAADVDPTTLDTATFDADELRGLDDRDHLHHLEVLAAYDPEDPEPDVLPGGGWAAYDPTWAPPLTPRVRPTPTPGQVLARAVATTLVTWRLDRGLRQRDVARRLGLSQATLSRLERGRGTISFEVLHRIAAVTGSTIEMTVVPTRTGCTVRRLEHEGALPDVRVQLVIDGPSARGSRAEPIS